MTATEQDTRDVLRQLVEAWQEAGRSVPNHRCNMGDAERAAWDATVAAWRYLAATEPAEL